MVNIRTFLIMLSFIKNGIVNNRWRSKIYLQCQWRFHFASLYCCRYCLSDQIIN
ncbi:unnamed protein product [Acanthoscelides obtectus]|uniref:Uncharacterized protein n=1 Tax=Acanthoscelides obtectus TaxID=200917 RepID=A0A9P0M5L7_ACAOB|nr:unnamed protein product [Acanthoscelides obtectus]CAK1660945.1 hypothetical protein AOBTE_LOCUS22354 [Acanthoscelides obtectus]